jgi:hypothetical protein
MRTVPRFFFFFPGICFATEGKGRKKTSVRVAGECQLAKSIQNRAYVSIRIHKHNNKNTKLTELNKVCKTYNHIQNDKKNKEPEEHHYTATLRYTNNYNDDNMVFSTYFDLVGHLQIFLWLNEVKVKCTLVEALRLCTGRTAHRKVEV